MTRPLPGRRWVFAALALAVVAAPAGCGVPSESDVVVRGPGRSAGLPAGDDDIKIPLGQAAAPVDKPEAFVDNFLAAAAGTYGQALGRARRFLPKQNQQNWHPDPTVNIVHVDDISVTPGGTTDRATYEVQLKVTHLGDLVENGMVERPRRQARTYKFDVAEVRREAGEAAQTGLFVTANAPPVLLLEDTALETYFERQTLYFWSRDRETLVPDLRYLPRDVPVSERPTLIVKWLLDGPSGWLEPTVNRVRAQLIGNVPVEVDSLQVRLSQTGGTDAAAGIDALATQLRWSLRRSPDRTLDLGVDATRKPYTDSEYVRANPASRDVTRPVQMCVYQGQVRQLSTAPPPPDMPALPALASSAIETAAVHRDRDTGKVYVALVRTVRGKSSLHTAGGGKMRKLEVAADTFGRPVWLPNSEGLGLVVADGKLRQFLAGEARAGTVAGVPDGITALAVPPDGRRVAYIHRGRLYVAALLRDGPSVAVAPDDVQEVATGLRNLAAVAWSQQTSLVVAGQLAGGSTVIQDMTVDGALVEVRIAKGLGEALVTHLVAFTDDPADNAAAGQVMFVANDAAYSLFSAFQPLKPEHIVPAAGASDKQPRGEVSVPFFLD